MIYHTALHYISLLSEKVHDKQAHLSLFIGFLSNLMWISKPLALREADDESGSIDIKYYLGVFAHKVP